LPIAATAAHDARADALPAHGAIALRSVAESTSDCRRHVRLITHLAAFYATNKPDVLA
jgi:hypothetical protein